MATSSSLCNTSPCPVDCTWNNWGPWDSCSATCGSGTMTKSRTTNGPLYGGTPCTGSSTFSTSCSTSACPAYKVVTSSLVTCNRITSMSECETAALALGLSDTTVINDGENGSDDPPYCYYET